VSIEPEGVCVAVRDTGHGLRPESLPRLFEPFYTTKPDSMGMGLSICRSIIEAHVGDQVRAGRLRAFRMRRVELRTFDRPVAVKPRAFGTPLRGLGA
jgi:C4-dicarboxylate-specific signal transduction histidine kinase